MVARTKNNMDQVMQNAALQDSYTPSILKLLSLGQQL
jgi:hypothetical protein